MKNKGFTLIELLAVIVILAIIALIATPTILGVIEKAKKGAAESSALGYIDAVEKAIATDMLDSSSFETGTYTINSQGNLVLGDKVLEIEIKGEKPNTGTVIINDKYEVSSAYIGLKKYDVTYGGKKATAHVKDDDTAKYEAAALQIYDSLGEVKNPCDVEKCSLFGSFYGTSTLNFKVLKNHQDNFRIPGLENNVEVNLYTVSDESISTSYPEITTFQTSKDIKLDRIESLDVDKGETLDICMTFRKYLKSGNKVAMDREENAVGIKVCVKDGKIKETTDNYEYTF